MTIRAWNVHRALERKLNYSNFLASIKECDITILTECWFSNEFVTSDYDLTDFHSIVVQRKKCKGGGICVLIRNSLKQKISMVKLTEDSLVWLKFDKSMFTNDRDLFICCAYIPPEGNSFYTHYDCDLFDKLESDIEYFSNQGAFCIIGDINARTGTLDDGIKYDYINQQLPDRLEHLFHYQNDTAFPKRNTKDNQVNSHGRKIISLCKESGLRIINGRTERDLNGEITFQNRQGTSLIDISAIHFSVFEFVKDFSVGEFTEYSDHAHITLTLKSIVTQRSPSCTCARRTVTTTMWNPDLAQQIHECVLVNQDSLSACVNNIADINETIMSLTSLIKSVTDQFCSKTFSKIDLCEYCKINKSYKQKNTNNKPWFDDECARKYKVYKTALAKFNRNKTFANRIYLANVKSTYKSYEAKMKRSYHRQEGNMLDNMKRKNPKQFYKFFRKKRKFKKSNLTVEDFFQYFSNLMSGENDDPQIIQDREDTNCFFSELDENFSEAEISKQIHNLKKDKSPGIDGLLNEMFVECENVFLPIFTKLFNHILSTGVYPKDWCKGIVIPIFKKGDSEDAGNYRPITLISHLAKLLHRYLTTDY